MLGEIKWSIKYMPVSMVNSFVSPSLYVSVCVH